MHSIKRRWYEAEQNLRKQTERTNKTRMDLLWTKWRVICKRCAEPTLIEFEVAGQDWIWFCGDFEVPNGHH